MGKVDPRSDEGKFLGYPPFSCAFRVFNKCTLCVEESVHVVFDDSNLSLQLSVEDPPSHPPQNSPSSPSTIEESTPSPKKSIALLEKVIVPREWRYSASYPNGFIIGSSMDRMQTRASLKKQVSIALVSQMEPKKVDEALKDESWVNVMKEELEQFNHSDAWTLVEKPKNCSIIGTKWVFQNKMDENRNMIRNKARLVAPVARLESIRIFLAYAFFYHFKLFQVDVKNAFLNGFIKENFFVK